MSKPKYPWPLSLVFTPHVFADGSELWPSGGEEFSYLAPDKRRIRVVVANPPIPSGREYVVFTKSIKNFVGGQPVPPEVKSRVLSVFEEYFLTKKQKYRFES